MVTIHDVASAAEVSVTTVSRALNGRGRVGSTTRARILSAADRLGYQPNDLARSLHGKSTNTIAVLVPDITNPFFPELVNGIQTVANENGGLLLLCQTFGDSETAVQELVNLRRKQCEGVILVGVPGGDDLSTAAKGMRIVSVDRDAAIPSASVVRSDHEHGARLATEHLIALGHEKIAHVGGPPHLQVAQARRRGYVRALEEAGLSVDESLIVDGNFLEDGGYEAIMGLRRRRKPFTAVSCANDLTAIGVIRALDTVGLAVPAEVSVIGFDDIHLASYVRPSLTTVHQPIEQLGRRAAELLLQPGDRPEEVVHEVLEVEVVLRETTRRRAAPGEVRGDRSWV